MSDANPYIEAMRQLEFDIEQLKVDAGLVQNDEVRTFIRQRIYEKQRTILAWIKEFAEVDAAVKGGRV